MRKNQKVMVNLGLLLITGVLVAFICFNLSVFNKNMLAAQYVPNSPSYLSVSENGTLYMVDDSKKSVYIIDKSGKVKRIITPESDSFYSIEAVEPDGKDTIYLKITDMVSGTLISKETIYRYNFENRKYQEITAVYYDTKAGDGPLQYGNICAIKVIDGVLYYVQRNFHANENREPDIRLFRCNNDGTATEVSRYSLNDYSVNEKELSISQAAVLTADGEILFNTREGQIFLGQAGKTHLLYDPHDNQTNSASIPWKLAADSLGEMYYADLGKRSIVRLSDNSVSRSTDNAILYDFTVADDGRIYATDYTSVYSGMPSGQLVKMEGAFRYSTEHILFRLSLLIAMVVSAVLLLYFIIILVRFASARPAPSLTIRLSALAVSAAVVITVIVSVQSCNTLQQQENKWIDTTLSRFAYTMQKIISDNEANSRALEEINSLSDFKTDAYRELQKELNRLCESSYYAEDDSGRINNPIYYILYKKVGDSVCSVMDFEDSMCAIHPMADYEGSEYQPVFEEGKVSSYQSDSAYGRWTYQLYPIRTFGTGEIDGVLEIGVNSDDLASTMGKLITNIIVEIAFVTVLFVMVLMEVIMISGYARDYFRQRKNGGLLTGEHDLFGYLRMITFFVYLCDSMQESFISFASESIYQPVLGISGQLAAALPISLQMLAAAVFTVLSGRFVRRFSMRRILLFGFLIDLIGFIICAFAITLSYPLLLVGKAALGCGLGICISMANVSASSFGDDKARGKAFAALNAGILAGATIGFSLGSYVAASAGYAAVYISGSVLLVFVLLLASKLVPDKQLDYSEEKISNLSFLKNWKVIGFLLCALLPFLVLINYREYFFTRFANEKGYSEDFTGKLFLFCGLIIIYLGPVISEKLTGLFGNKIMILLASGTFLLALSIFVLSPTMTSAIIGVFLVSLGISFGYTAQSGYYTGLPVIRRTDEGSAMGMYLLVDSVGQTIGPVLFGGAVSLGNRQGIAIMLTGFAVFLVGFCVTAFFQKKRSSQL